MGTKKDFAPANNGWTQTWRLWRHCCCRSGVYPLFVALFVSSASLLDMYSTAGCDFMTLRVGFTPTNEAWSQPKTELGLFTYQSNVPDTDKYKAFINDGCRSYPDQFENTFIHGDRTWTVTRIMAWTSGISGLVALVTVWLMVISPLPPWFFWPGVLLPAVLIALLTEGAKFLFFDSMVCNSKIWQFDTEEGVTDYASAKTCVLGKSGKCAIASAALYFVSILLVCMKAPEKRTLEEEFGLTYDDMEDHLELRSPDLYDSSDFYNEAAPPKDIEVGTMMDISEIGTIRPSKQINIFKSKEGQDSIYPMDAPSEVKKNETEIEDVPSRLFPGVVESKKSKDLFQASKDSAALKKSKRKSVKSSTNDTVMDAKQKVSTKTAGSKSQISCESVSNYDCVSLDMNDESEHSYGLSRSYSAASKTDVEKGVGYGLSKSSSASSYDLAIEKGVDHTTVEKSKSTKLKGLKKPMEYIYESPIKPEPATNRPSSEKAATRSKKEFMSIKSSIREEEDDDICSPQMSLAQSITDTHDIESCISSITDFRPIGIVDSREFLNLGMESKSGSHDTEVRDPCEDTVPCKEKIDSSKNELIDNCVYELKKSYGDDHEKSHQYIFY